MCICTKTTIPYQNYGCDNLTKLYKILERGVNSWIYDRMDFVFRLPRHWKIIISAYQRHSLGNLTILVRLLSYLTYYTDPQQYYSTQSI